MNDAAKVLKFPLIAQSLDLSGVWYLARPILCKTENIIGEKHNVTLFNAPNVYFRHRQHV